MKQNALPRLLLGLLLLMCFVLPAAAAPDAPLEALLGQVPATAFDAGYISYADYTSLLAARPGAKAPSDTDDFAAFQRTPEGRAYFLAMRGVSSGSTALLSALMLSDQIEQESGIKPFAITQSLEAGLPPSQQVWLKGTIDKEAVAEALKLKDYQTSGGSDEWALWCEGGNCENGHLVDLSRRDPAFLFGGDLGRRWPVVLGEGLLASSPDSQVIGQIAQGNSQSLLDLPQIRDVLEAVRALPGDNQVTQFQLYSPEVIFANTPTDKAADAFGLFHLDAQDALRVVLALRYPDPASANSALALIEKSLETITLSTGQPLESRISELEGSDEPLKVHQAQGGAGVLMLSFRFPAQAEALAREPESASALPFALFYSMAIRGDMDWLNQ